MTQHDHDLANAADLHSRPQGEHPDDWIGVDSEEPEPWADLCYHLEDGEWPF